MPEDSEVPNFAPIDPSDPENQPDEVEQPGQTRDNLAKLRAQLDNANPVNIDSLVGKKPKKDLKLDEFGQIKKP